MIALGLVVLLHILLGYAFVTGLALKAVKAIVEPIEAVNVKEEAPPPEEPPPPPPKDVEIPPYVPPPEVSVQTEAPAPTITTQTTVAQPEPPRVTAPPAPPAPPAPAGPSQRATPKGRGNTLTDDDYPDASRRAEEQGLTRAKVSIGADGRPTGCEVAQSSGFPRLDDAACKIIMRRFRYNPALKDGTPVADVQNVPIRWVLKN